MPHPDKIGTQSIPRLLAQFAIPSIFSLVLHAFYNIVDRIFIGQGIGSLGLAGVTICFPVVLLLFGVCLLFSSGGAVLISLKLGERRLREAEEVLGTTVALITLVGIAISAGGFIFHKGILSLTRVSADVFPFARDYLKIISAGSVLFLYGFTMTFAIRAQGNPLYATTMIVAGTLINVGLDALFIFSFGWGTAGAALATIISEAVVVVLGVAYLVRKKTVLRIRSVNFRLQPRLIKRIVILGLSPALMNIITSIRFWLLNERLVRYGGDRSVAAMGVVFALGSLVMMFTFGMAGGMQPIIGYNYGARNFNRVQETFIYASRVTFLVAAAIVGSVMLGARQIAGLFCGDDVQLLALSAHAVRTFLVMTPLAALHVLITRYFQAVGKGGVSVAVGLTRPLIVFLPALYILSSRFGLLGVWVSGPVADVIATAVALLFIGREMLVLSREAASLS